MGIIADINKIAEDRQKATDISYRILNKRSKGDYRCFADILQEELDKAKRGDK